jgi:plasmid maintenance system antidote protein VapI
MAKDKRYKTVKNLITGGYIKSFSEIWDTLPKTVVARDLKMHHQTFSRLISSPEGFSFEAAIKIALLFEVDSFDIINLIYYQLILDKKIKKNK